MIRPENEPAEKEKGLAERKKQVRQEIRLLRRELDPEKKKKMDEEILANIWDFLMPERKPVFLYASIGKEVDTWALLERLWKEKIPVALPRVEGPLIRFYWVKSREKLAPGAMGIREPVDGCPEACLKEFPKVSLEMSPEVYSEACAETSPEASLRSAIVLTPGLAFSPDGRRIGYGGGYYDRFFAGRKDLLRVGLAYPFQIREDLPDDPRDEPLDRIFTPERIYICDRIRRA